MNIGDAMMCAHMVEAEKRHNELLAADASDADIDRAYDTWWALRTEYTNRGLSLGVTA